MGSLKPIATVLSTLLIGGVAIGLISGVRKIDNNGAASKSDDDYDLSSASKPVKAFCEPTDHKKACVDSLGDLSRNDSAAPRDYVMLAITVAADAVNQSIDKSEFISKEASSQGQKDAFVDCITMLNYAIDELEHARSSLEEANQKAMLAKKGGLKNWLSATISYQQSCIDIIDEPLKMQVTHAINNGTRLTGNVLAMVSNLKSIFKSLGDDISDGINPRRKLLGGYADRKLLEVIKNGSSKPNVVVAQDGSGEFKTINAALAAYPKHAQGRRYTIYVKAGLYKEQVVIGKHMTNVFMYGDGPKRTVVTGKLNAAQGTNTYRTATFAAIGNGFICKSMGFENTAGPEGHQAVALRVQSDKSVFFNCRIEGFQDSLYAQTHRQFYRNCVISGTVDIIFGDSTTLIQNSIIIVRKPKHDQVNTITAQGKSDAHESTGIVIHNSKIVPDRQLFKDRFKIPTFIGRPWKQYSTAAVMESTLGDFIQPAGWMAWNGADFALDKLVYVEYKNEGPGASTAHRVDWKGWKVITDRNEAMRWTAGEFLQGKAWISDSGTPFLAGLAS